VCHRGLHGSAVSSLERSKQLHPSVWSFGSRVATKRLQGDYRVTPTNAVLPYVVAHGGLGGSGVTTVWRGWQNAEDPGPVGPTMVAASKLKILKIYISANYNYLKYRLCNYLLPIQVAARSKAWLLWAGVGCLSSCSCRYRPFRRADHPSKGVLTSVLIL
jgi:hypothetical protein